MAWKKILEEQANSDSPTFILYLDDKISAEDVQKIVIKTIYPKKTHTLYFADEEIEDFYFFIQAVKDESLRASM